MLIERDTQNFQNLEWLGKYLIGHKGFIAGGCFKNIFNKEKIKDLDIFFRNEIDYNEAINWFENEKDSDGCKKYTLYYENPKVKAYKEYNTDLILELIRFEYGTPEEILNRFDFTIVKFAYFKKITLIDNISNSFEENLEEKIEDKIIMDDMFFEHLFEKRLVIDNEITFPVGTFERMFKYAKYGYFPCRESKLKIINAIKNDTKDPQISNSLYEGFD